MKSSAYDVNINLYEAMTEDTINGAPEVAAGGYDAEVGAFCLIFSRLNSTTSVTSGIMRLGICGETVSLYMEPTSRLSVEAGAG